MKRLLIVAPLVLAACSLPPPQAAPTPSKSAPAAQPTPVGAPATSTPAPESEEEEAPAGKACELITAAEAKKLAGVALQEGVEGPENSPGCTYTSPPTGSTAQVELYLGDGAKKFLDVDRELGHEFTDVPGVGDEATAEDNTIFFRVGRTWALIRLVRLDNEPGDNADALRVAAGKVASRL